MAGDGDVWFIGGARIYEEAMRYVDVIDVTYVPDHVDGPGAVHAPGSTRACSSRGRSCRTRKSRTSRGVSTAGGPPELLAVPRHCEMNAGSQVDAWHASGWLVHDTRS